MKTRILIKEGEYKLSRAGVMDSKIDAEELFCFLTGWDKVVLFLKKEEEVDKDTEAKYFGLIERRANRIPLQHITGVQEFMGFEFSVSPEVLIPRQDTEILVIEAAKVLQLEHKEALEKKRSSVFGGLKSGAKLQVLDLCCGSGAIGISLARICEGVNVTATDISLPALELAAENCRRLRTDVEFYIGDMFEALASGDRIVPGNKEGSGCSRKGIGRGARIRDFDMIVTNPPYIKTNSIAMLQEEVKKHEPLLALDGGRDGLEFYKAIVAKAAHWLKPEGWLMMEIGFDQGEDLRKMIRDSGLYTATQIIKDLPGKDRVVKCRKK